MLEHSFIHMRGIGPVGERRLWSRGFLTWQDVNGRGEQDRIAARARLSALESTIRLGRRDAAFFGATLPPPEKWRIYPDFLDDAAFLDVETTGALSGEGAVTLVGVLGRNGYHAYIRGEDLDEVPEALQQFRLLVTFNGSSFDLPCLEAEFGSGARWSGMRLFEHVAHFDLRYPLRRLGHSGGLKEIERRLGVGRPDELSHIDGFDAIRLWRMYCEGEPGALATLVRYNAEDVASLPKLAAFVAGTLASGTPMANGPIKPGPEIDRPSLPYDPGLVEYLGRGKRKLMWT
ncbi:MAG: ribonuclease H-like domain-containing protein [Chloroflexi bacterium]|nr:ribonuclease H-like domain-containing protein [Chloroflexota bacterium]